jgi:hypothetical protein
MNRNKAKKIIRESESAKIFSSLTQSALLLVWRTRRKIAALVTHESCHYAVDVESHEESSAMNAIIIQRGAAGGGMI